MIERAKTNVRQFPDGGHRLPHSTYVGTIAPERVRWLSPGRLAYGKTTVLDGDPGLGKSTMTLDWAAKITRGEALPDGEPTRPRSVLVLSAEDGAADTIRPRLEVAGADLMRVILLTMRNERGEDDLVSIPEDIPALTNILIDQDVALVIIDPLMAFLSSETNANRDQDVRRSLAPLATLAEETDAAILMIRHLNKSVGGQSLYRGGGSIGIIGAARFGLMVGRKEESKDLRVLTTVKANIGPEPQSWEWKLTGVPGTDVAKVEWLGHSEITASDIVEQARTSEERDAYAEAKEWLIETLDPGAMTVKEIKRLARDAGISEATLKRAKFKLGLKHQRDGFGGEVTWDLPDTILRSKRDHSDQLKTPHVRTMENPSTDNENDPINSHTAHSAQGDGQYETRQHPENPFEGGE